MAKLERIYTVPLGDAYNVSRSKRTPRAMKLLRAFITRHMKAKEERVVISEALNKLLWARSIQKPPRSVKVRLVKEDGVAVRAYLTDEKITEPKKEEKKGEEKKEAPKAAAKPEASKPETAKPASAPKAEARTEARAPKAAAAPNAPAASGAKQ